MKILFIFLGLFFGLNLVSSNLLIFILLTILVLFLLIKRYDQRTLMFFIIALAIGVGLSFLNLKLNPTSGSYLGIVIESKENYYVVYSKFERLIVYEKNNVREVGDIVILKGNISNLVDTSLESEFSFVDYLKYKGITRQINVSSIEVKFSNFIKIKAYKQHFLSLFNSDARNYVDMLLFNVKSYDSNEVLLINALNISYLFSTSGLYISLLFSVVEYFLFLKLDKKKTKIFSLIILSWYLIFTLNKIGIRRILYYKIFSLINEYKLKKRFTYLESISLIATMMLLLNRYLAYQMGFYLGVFTSLAFYFSRNTLTRGKKRTFISKTSIFSFLFMLPVTLLTNHEFHVFGFLIQMVVTPITIVFMFISVIAFYSYPIKPVFDISAKAITGTIKGLSYIDLALPFKELNNIFLFFYYLLLFIAIYLLESYDYKHLKILSVTSVVIFSILLTPYEYLYASSITFINVGQGDSCLIRNLDKTIMIDTGGLTYKDIAVNSLIPYLKKNKVYKIDYVFISHSDNDHTGALSSLKKNFRVNNVIDTSSPFKITIGDMEIENINKWADLYTDVNDKSQVLKFKIADKNILMMGDASKNIENKIMSEYKKEDFNIDILKLGHHGSNTSSSYEFLSFISPKEAIISVGKNNSYKHPHKETLENLNSLNIPYKRTDELGSISYYKNNFLIA